MQSILKSSASIVEAIDQCEAERDQAKKSIPPLEERRRSLLLANDAKGLNKLDADLANLLQTESRCIERLAVLHDELVDAESAEKTAELDKVREKADKLRGVGESLIRRYDVLASEMVSILAKLSVIDSFIEETNRRLPDQRVIFPNELRREPVVEVPAHSKEVEIREPGAYDAAGVPINPGMRAPRHVTLSIPAERHGGREPEPLYRTAFIPAGLWKSPAWHGAGRAYNYGPGALLPGNLRLNHDQVIAELLSQS